MWINQKAAIRAAEKSHSVRDNGGFIIAYYPDLQQYAYFMDEAQARQNGPASRYEVVGRYRKKGLLGYTRVEQEPQEE